MLDNDNDFFVQLLYKRMEGEPVNTTDKDAIICELIVSTEAGLDTQCDWLPLFNNGTSWNVNLESMTLLVVVQ